jgi:hypothetical protein
MKRFEEEAVADRKRARIVGVSLCSASVMIALLIAGFYFSNRFSPMGPAGSLLRTCNGFTLLVTPVLFGIGVGNLLRTESSWLRYLLGIVTAVISFVVLLIVAAFSYGAGGGTLNMH